MTKKVEKVLDKINKDLEEMASNWAHSNAHGVPITESGRLTLEGLNNFSFKEQINITHPYFSQVLRQIANILEKYF